MVRFGGETQVDSESLQVTCVWSQLSSHFVSRAVVSRCAQPANPRCQVDATSPLLVEVLQAWREFADPHPVHRSDERVAELLRHLVEQRVQLVDSTNRHASYEPLPRRPFE